jgi:hypothetical protein
MHNIDIPQTKSVTAHQFEELQIDGTINQPLLTLKSKKQIT